MFGAVYLLKPIISVYYLSIFIAVFITFDPTAYTVTEGVDAFAELTILRSGQTSGSTVVRVNLHSGTAVGMKLFSEWKYNGRHVFITEATHACHHTSTQKIITHTHTHTHTHDEYCNRWARLNMLKDTDRGVAS